MRAGGNPDIDELVTESLVEPVDPLEVAELFERQADGQGQILGHVLDDADDELLDRLADALMPRGIASGAAVACDP